MSDARDMFADLLTDRFGGREAFHAAQSGLRPDEALWAAQTAGQTVPMPSFGHAQQFAASTGGTITTWDGDQRSHTAALAKLHANADQATLDWLTGQPGR